jgi:hypothetical protein
MHADTSRCMETRVWARRHVQDTALSSIHSKYRRGVYRLEDPGPFLTHATLRVYTRMGSETHVQDWVLSCIYSEYRLGVYRGDGRVLHKLHSESIRVWTRRRVRGPEAFSCMKMTRSLRKISMADRLLPRVRVSPHVSTPACQPAQSHNLDGEALRMKIKTRTRMRARHLIISMAQGHAQHEPGGPARQSRFEHEQRGWMAGRRDWLPGRQAGEQREVCVRGLGRRRAGAVTDPNCRLRQMKKMHPAESRICAEKIVSTTKDSER